MVGQGKYRVMPGRCTAVWNIWGGKQRSAQKIQGHVERHKTKLKELPMAKSGITTDEQHNK